MRRRDDNRSTVVSELSVADATNRIYESLQADNADIDVHIAALKAALKREGLKEAVFDPARLVQNNRSGRKLMQAYFRQRGVTVTYAAS
jgi:predicted nucleic acid-binding Zn ribbon protein